MEQIENFLYEISYISWGTVIMIVIATYIINRTVVVNIFEAIHNYSKSRLVMLIYPIRYAIFWILLAIGFSLVNAFLQFSKNEIVIIERLTSLFIILAVFSYGKFFNKNLDEFLETFVSKNNRVFRQILPLLRFTLVAAVWAFLVLATLNSVFDVNISTWLAGLGILGLGLSLAMQDTFRNLVGSLMLVADKPFEENDRIVFSGNDGVVEKIGIRSSNVRMLSGELISVPNSKLADDIIQNLSERPSFRRILNIGITYDTPLKKISQAVEIIKEILAEKDPNNAPIYVNKELPPRVYFDEFGDFSLNIFVIYWYFPALDWWAFKEYSQGINLHIFEEFEKAGIEFAFPTQTVYLAGDQKRELVIKQLGKDLNKKK